MKAAGIAGVCLASAVPVPAQFQMPDPRQMSGIPRPVDDLPDATVSVRVIRGQLSNNLAGQTVTLDGGGQSLSAITDEGGRAEFQGMPPGTSVKASADVDGEHLESQAFPFPGRGGVRLMLVATDGSAPQKPAVAGEVTLGGQSRIVIEPDDETVRVYYLLSVVNAGTAPVNPPVPFAFDMPSGATGTSVLQGSSPQATATGSRVVVKGPFAPGETSLEVGCALPVSGGTLDLAARFPARMEQLSVIVKKLGDTKLSSPQLAGQREMAAEGQAYIAGQGGAVAAGEPIRLTLTGLPHHSATPRRVALALAIGIIVAGVWVSVQAPPATERARPAERKRLIARREKLFADLVRLELDARARDADETAFAARRAQLVSGLEHLYGALDDAESAASTDHQPASRHGRAPGGEGPAAANT
ncbi:MAG: hypothetical protein IT176_06090 [Acidobacteria bacterium]|nr:hypothetical protein [Acidobacteriota bacterium]